jgi:hypothetical protein
MNEIEHLDLIFIYRPGKLQLVADALSGIRNEGEPTDTERLLEIDDKSSSSNIDNLREKKEYVSDLEHLKRIVKEVHLDFGRYGKLSVVTEVKKRFSASLIEASKLIDAYGPWQLYKPPPRHIATLHTYDIKRPSKYWGIDYIEPLIKTKSSNEYLITAIDSVTSMSVVYALPARSTDAAIELLEDNGGIVQSGSDDSNEEMSQMLKWGYFLSS